ncbi:MAG: iron-containing alcohol dehydrogenase, partial [Planctomycetota bacterium]|nr:iron-containing alcohol dehydrogenase [Planctomycetota bacterium]
MRSTWTFHTANQFVFGRDAVAKLPEILERLKVARLLVVTDAILVKAGVVETVCAPLRVAGISIDLFDGGVPEPPLALGESCAAQARAFQADAVLGLGGGSNMDLAKLAAVLLTHGGTPT